MDERENRVRGEKIRASEAVKEFSQTLTIFFNEKKNFYFLIL